MRVAHFIQRYPPALGGSEAYFARLSRYLVTRGDDVTVFTSNAIELEAFWKPGRACVPAGVSVEDGVQVRRYALARWPGRRYMLKAASFWPHRLWQCLTVPCNPICPAMWRDAGRGDFECDAVHASAFPYAWPIACGLRLARRLRVPLLLTPFLHLGNLDDPHDRTRRGYTAPALRWLLRQADAVFAQTPSEAEALARLGVAPPRIHLQGLGVNPAECTGGDRADARSAWRIRPGEIVVGHLANNSWEKGTNDLLQAVERLWRRGLPVRVVLAGPEMPNFQRFWSTFAPRLPSPHAVVRLGPLTEQQKRDFFAGLDVFALPSRSDSFGLVLLEAWANGVPNVAYRAGGIADVIRHERDGLLAPCGDVAQLTDLLGRACESAVYRTRLGRAGQERLAMDFDWDEKLRRVRTVLARHGGAQKKSDRPSTEDAANPNTRNRSEVEQGRSAL
jgi:glycosyltransferase involved in cell wall biosynthesis